MATIGGAGAAEVERALSQIVTVASARTAHSVSAASNRRYKWPTPPEMAMLNAHYSTQVGTPQTGQPVGVAASESEVPKLLRRRWAVRCLWEKSYLERAMGIEPTALCLGRQAPLTALQAPSPYLVSAHLLRLADGCQISNR